MERVKKSPLLRKLKKVLAEQFPPPAKLKLDEYNGVFGVITSDRFADMDSTERQRLIREIVAAHLTPEERRQILLLVGVTSEEGTGYLAGLD